MGLTASNSGGNFELAPQGVYAARCFKMVDLGTQPTEFQGQKKLQHKVMIGWELLGDEMMEDGKPFSVMKRYTVSLHEKSQLRKDLEAWRGKQFTPEEEALFDLTKVIGAYCMLNIVHETSKAGTEYANIASIMPLPKSMPKPDGINPVVAFDLDSPDMEIFESFSDKLKATIMAAPEWGNKLSDDVPSGAGNLDDIEF